MINILMALCDFIPVVCFLIGAIFLQRDLYNKMSKGAFAVFSTGTIVVFMAGVFKAIQKILFYANICNFVPLELAFFPMQSMGFLLAGIGVLAMVVHPQGEYKTYSLIPLSFVFILLADNIAPKEWSGTMMFVVLMILGMAILYGSLIYISVLNKCALVIVLLVISFLFTLGMGYLSTNKEISDWVKEAVNIVGQGTYLAAAIILRKKGLGNAEFKIGKRKEA